MQLQWLARDLCTRLGFCAISREIYRFRDLRTMDAAEWVEQVFRAEELESDARPDLRKQVRDLITEWMGTLP